MNPIEMRRLHCDRRVPRTDFPSRTNPARPPTTPSEPARRPDKPRADASYPARCNPNPRPPLNDVQRELAMRYLPLARALAQGFAKSWPAGRDDFQASACLALVEAAQGFDESKGVDFATFARLRIRGALIDAQRGFFSDGWRGAVEFKPKFQPLGPDAEGRGTLIGASGEEPVGTSLERQDDVEYWLRRLPSRHSSAFRLIYLEGKTQEQAAEILGVSKASMCRMHRETLIWIDQARLAQDARGRDRLSVAG
ncbi:sigma-70 family RNA polymerase sigma factor [Paludisphaera soli]|uniref:sigma-70 family RNA polymerase sigma factor n=1 Tax=Paludisphaera soli TaxID=2712865 RepID=UPI0013EABE34|nr:sigma-70 family RNA polymerase sigma factor [Paludisphaera soli]